jgi:hypothetical protein
MKGFEVPCRPFVDGDGKPRDRKRATWWNSYRNRVLSDRLQVFGHYCNFPPNDGDRFVPPYAPGHPKLIDWETDQTQRRVRRTSAKIASATTAVCIDFRA